MNARIKVAKPDIKVHAVKSHPLVTEFRDFVLRGNIIELAVAVVVGTKFSAVVTAVVAGLITPLIGAIGGTPDFSDVAFTINGSRFAVGTVINELISFLIVAAVIFFAVVKPMNMLLKRIRPGAAMSPVYKQCPECTMDIPLAARRCPQCTSVLIPAETA